MTTPKMGGRDVLSVLLKGGADLENCILSRAEGGRKLEHGLAGLIKERYAGAFRLELMREPSGPSRDLREEIERLLANGRPSTRILDARPDVVVFSGYPDLIGAGPLLLDSYRADMDWVIRTLKREVGAHLIFLNASTVDPDDLTSNYHASPEQPFSLKAHQLDTILMELSFAHGISIVDADRLLAELGASTHVLGPLVYSPEACGALCAELARVLEDYGFFEERPLVMQVGRQAAGS
jgi:hypothetical protein